MSRTDTTLATVEQAPANNELSCGEVAGTSRTTEIGSRPLVDTDALRSGMWMSVSVDELPVRAKDEGMHGSIRFRVDDIRRSGDSVTDIFGTTPSGRTVHAYPRRGKVVTHVDGDERRTYSLVNTLGYTERPRWTSDNHECRCSDGLRLVTVDGVTVAACHHHEDAAKQYAAEIAGVELSGHKRRLRPDTSPKTRRKEYDVSDTLAALEEQRDEGFDRCGSCNLPLVPDGDGGTTCPLGHSGDGDDDSTVDRGEGVATDGGVDIGHTATYTAVRLSHEHGGVWSFDVSDEYTNEAAHVPAEPEPDKDRLGEARISRRVPAYARRTVREVAVAFDGRLTVGCTFDSVSMSVWEPDRLSDLLVALRDVAGIERVEVEMCEGSRSCIGTYARVSVPKDAFRGEA